MPVRSFVAVGDSFTEGLHDELDRNGRHRGWADRTALALARRDGALRYANLAIRGRLLDQVVAEQVPVALELGADVVSFHAGGNDLLRPGVEVVALARRYDDAVASLAAAGRTVVLFTALERAGSTGRFADALAARFAAFNRYVRETAGRYGVVLVDLGAATALQDRRMWHDDRLHLGPHGHARVAAAVLEGLGVDDASLLGGRVGWWRQPLGPLRTGRVAAAAADLRWVGRHLLPWVGRRIRGVSSGDDVACKHPELVEVGNSAGG